jgi:hypothetical protein
MEQEHVDIITSLLKKVEILDGCLRVTLYNDEVMIRDAKEKNVNDRVTSLVSGESKAYITKTIKVDNNKMKIASIYKKYKLFDSEQVFIAYFLQLHNETKDILIYSNHPLRCTIIIDGVYNYTIDKAGYEFKDMEETSVPICLGAPDKQIPRPLSAIPQAVRTILGL